MPSPSPSLAPLTNLAEDLVDVVPQVEPTAQFRQDLHKALEMTYRQQAAQRQLGTRPAPTIDGTLAARQSSLWALAMLLVTLFLLRVYYGGRSDAVSEA